MWTLWILPLACPSGSDSGTSADSADSGTVFDSGTVLDSADSGDPLDFPLGDLSGDCKALDDGVWESTQPALFRNVVDLDGWDEDLLSEGGAEILADGNLGGSSLESEILAFEVLRACEGASLSKTEGEISYRDDGGKKTDLLVEIDTRSVGVSVTRAFHWPPEDPYTEAEAADLLTDKLGDVLLSAANAAPPDAWSRSMLHVVAYDGQYGDEVEAAWAGLGPEVRDATLVVLTITDGDDEVIY